MKERPILFSGPMVRALLAGTKTQTRRVVQNPHRNDAGFVLQDYGKGFWPYRSHDGESGCYLDRQKDGDYYSEAPLRCPYGQPGDRLWVRETWMPDAPRNGEWPDVSFYGCGMSPLSDIPECYRHPWHCLYRATHYGCELVGWKPGMHMPRWASRILLEVTEVRVERLQDISDDDAAAEGCPCYVCSRIMDGRSEDDCHCFHKRGDARDYRNLWEDINGPESWAANPWVWAVNFKVLP